MGRKPEGLCTMTFTFMQNLHVLEFSADKLNKEGKGPILTSSDEGRSLLPW